MLHNLLSPGAVVVPAALVYVVRWLLGLFTGKRPPDPRRW
jgi:hypothetical protein